MPPSGDPSPTVLITGSARRIGRAIAVDMARAGWQVCVHYRRSAADAEAVVAEIVRAGGRAVALSADLAREADVAELVPRCREALGAPTCLINNASEFLVDTVATTTPETWDTHLDINLKAPVFLAKSLFLNLPEGQAGNVINIIDQRVWKLTPDFFSYTISKAGLWTATRTLAQALAPDIRVNGIGPGPTLPSARQTDEQFQRQWDAVPLRRGTTPEEICDAVRYIIAAPAMTGQMIALDGGEHLGWAQPTRGFVARE